MNSVLLSALTADFGIACVIPLSICEGQSPSKIELSLNMGCLTLHPMKDHQYWNIKNSTLVEKKFSWVR